MKGQQNRIELVTKPDPPQSRLRVLVRRFQLPDQHEPQRRQGPGGRGSLGHPQVRRSGSTKHLLV